MNDKIWNILAITAMCGCAATNASAALMSLTVSPPAFLTQWNFAGQFATPSGGEFSGTFWVASDVLFDGAAGLTDYRVGTTASGAFAAEAYRLVAIAQANQFLFTNAAYVNGAGVIPTDILQLVCGTPDVYWWDGQATQTDCTVTEYQNIVFTGDFKVHSGPDMIVRTTSGISLVATVLDPSSNPYPIPEPSTVALIGAAFLAAAHRRKHAATTA